MICSSLCLRHIPSCPRGENVTQLFYLSYLSLILHSYDDSCFFFFFKDLHKKEFPLLTFQSRLCIDSLSSPNCRQIEWMTRAVLEINSLYQFRIQRQIDGREASCRKSTVQRASLEELKTYENFTLAPRISHAEWPLWRSKLQKSKFTISQSRIPHPTNSGKQILPNDISTSCKLRKGKTWKGKSKDRNL